MRGGKERKEKKKKDCRFNFARTVVRPTPPGDSGDLPDPLFLC